MEKIDDEQLQESVITEVIQTCSYIDFPEEHENSQLMIKMQNKILIVFMFCISLHFFCRL